LDQAPVIPGGLDSSMDSVAVIVGLIFWACVMIWVAQFVIQALIGTGRFLIDRRRVRESVTAESVERSLRSR
jgi:hypothetical protein